MTLMDSRSDMDDIPEVKPKSLRQQALEIMPELLSYIDYLCLALCKLPERNEAYQTARRILEEKAK